MSETSEWKIFFYEEWKENFFFCWKCFFFLYFWDFFLDFLENSGLLTCESFGENWPSLNSIPKFFVIQYWKLPYHRHRTFHLPFVISTKPIPPFILQNISISQPTLIYFNTILIYVSTKLLLYSQALSCSHKSTLKNSNHSIIHKI